MTIITLEKMTEEMHEGIRLLEIGLEKVAGLKNKLIQLIKETDNTEILNDAESCYDELLITEKTNGLMRFEIWQWVNQIKTVEVSVENVDEEKITFLEKTFREVSMLNAMQENLVTMLNNLWERHFSPGS